MSQQVRLTQARRLLAEVLFAGIPGCMDCDRLLRDAIGRIDTVDGTISYALEEGR